MKTAILKSIWALSAVAFVACCAFAVTNALIGDAVGTVAFSSLAYFNLPKNTSYEYQ